MPKTKFSRPQVGPWEKYRGVILSRMVEYGLDMAEMAARMGVSCPTFSKWISDPGTMSMDTMRKLNRVLDITAEAAREALAVK